MPDLDVVADANGAMCPWKDGFYSGRFCSACKSCDLAIKISHGDIQDVCVTAFWMQVCNHLHAVYCRYTGWPNKNGTVDTVNFLGLALINNYPFSPCWIEHHFLIIITPRSSNLVENFLFY